MTFRLSIFLQKFLACRCGLLWHSVMVGYTSVGNWEMLCQALLTEQQVRLSWPMALP